MYRRAYLQPWLMCITQEEGIRVLYEIHEGVCGSHEKARTIAEKAFTQSLFWPRAMEDAKRLVKQCVQYHKHDFISHTHAERLIAIGSP